jgi:phosphoglycerate dehydrogenase-like enzyme
MDQLFAAEDLRRLKRGANVVWARNADLPPAELARHRDADAIICGYWRYGEVSAFPRLKAVVEVGGGLPGPRGFDYADAFRRRITVASCAPGFGPAVAEMALALTLACTRNVVETDRRFRTGRERWEFAETQESFTLFDRTVGFIGYGGLARTLRPMLDPFRVKVLAYDPWQPAARLRAQQAEPCGLDRLLRTARVIYVLAIPTAANRGLLDRRRLSLIRRDAVLILISRSHLVDFKALTDLIRRRRFRAGIDVFPREPLPRSHPIRRTPWTVLSSHKAGAMDEAMKLIGRWTVDDLLAVLRGRKPTHMQVATPALVARLRG